VTFNLNLTCYSSTVAGLRDRWRNDAMRAIQESALDLFDERGFAAVKIDDIAAAAEVSASSIYRYFGTKEGVLVADEFDTMSEEAIQQVIDVTDPVGSLIQAVMSYEAPSSDGSPTPARRIRYFFEEPSVRRAVCATLDRAAQRIAPLLVSDAMTETQARVAANALAFGYFGALEQWYLDGGERPIAAYVEEGLRPLRRLWSSGSRRG